MRFDECVRFEYVRLEDVIHGNQHTLLNEVIAIIFNEEEPTLEKRDSSDEIHDDRSYLEWVQLLGVSNRIQVKDFKFVG